MSELTIRTLDWVPEGPRGFVRDLRLRWAREVIGLRYAVRTIPFEDRETNHLAQQPFGQVPFRRTKTWRSSKAAPGADQIGHFEAADQKRAEGKAY